VSARAIFTYFNSQCTYVTAPAGNLELFGAPKFLAIIDELAIPQMQVRLSPTWLLLILTCQAL